MGWNKNGLIIGIVKCNNNNNLVMKRGTTKRERERNKTQEKQVMHNTVAHSCWPMASPSLSSSWPLMASPLSVHTSPAQFFILSMMCCDRNIHLASSGQLCSLPSLCVASHWHSMGHWKVLDSGEALPSNYWNHQRVINIIIILKPKTIALYQLLKRKLTLSKQKPGHSETINLISLL